MDSSKEGTDESRLVGAYEGKIDPQGARKYKMGDTILYQKKHMSAMKYLQKIARVLPTCKGADGVPFRHLQNLKTLYKRGGIDAIDFYTEQIRGQINAQMEEIKKEVGEGK